MAKVGEGGKLHRVPLEGGAALGDSLFSLTQQEAEDLGEEERGGGTRKGGDMFAWQWLRRYDCPARQVWPSPSIPTLAATAAPQRKQRLNWRCERAGVATRVWIACYAVLAGGVGSSLSSGTHNG